jgi:hypothetical protein
MKEGGLLRREDIKNTLYRIYDPPWGTAEDMIIESRRPK